jgi:ABC-2 type transport system permease protein
MNHALWLLSIRPKIWRNWIKRFNIEHIVSVTIIFCLLIIFWMIAFVFFRIVLHYLINVPPIGTILINRLLSLIFLALFLMTAFSDIITALSIMYLSRDLGLLHHHPINSLSIFIDKFIQTIFYGSWAVIFIGIPLYIAYGYVFNVDWYFYPLVILSNIPFLIISAGLATIVTLILAYIVPANRARTITIFLIGLLFFSVGLYLRFLQTGEMLGINAPKTDLSSYLFNLRLSSTPYLPNQWLTQIFQNAAERNYSDLIFYTLLLFTTAALIIQICIQLARKVYHTGWIKAGEAVSIKIRGTGMKSKIIAAIFRLSLYLPFSSPIRALIIKDIKTFWRDLTQWGQLTLLVALIMVYLFNTRSFISSGGFGGIDYFWRHLIGLVNIGLTEFVLGNLAIRFVYPLISLEGRIIWVIRSSPLKLSTFFWVKFWLALLTMMIIGLGLTGLSIYLLRLDVFVASISLITVFFVSIGITSLAMGLGAFFPTFNVENPMQLTTGVGAVLSVILSMLYIAATIMIVAYPMNEYFYVGANFHAVSNSTLIYPALCLIGLTAVAAIFPIKFGLQKLYQRSK